MERARPLCLLQGQEQGIFSLQEEEGSEESRLCPKTEGDILFILKAVLTDFIMQVPRNSKGGFLDDNSEAEEEEEDEGRSEERVSKSKKAASRPLKKSVKKGKK